MGYSNQEGASKRLSGKVALITGSSRGVGKQAALLFANEGADIVVAGRTQKQGESPYPGTIYETADEVRALGRRALPIAVDLRVAEEVQGMCRKAIDEFGRVDILINNAWYNSGKDFGPEGLLESFLTCSLGYWNSMIAVNLTAPFVACRELVPHMIKQGSGIIFCTTSSVAINQNPVPFGRPGSTNVSYGSSKAALNRFVLHLATELKPHNIPVIAIDPGFTRTPQVELRHGKNAERAKPADVPRRTMLYLCTCPNPLWYSGKVIVVDDFIQEHNLV